MEKQTFCISGFLLSLLAFAINPWGSVSILAIVFSSIGLKERRQLGDKGFCVSGLCAGIVSLVIKIAEILGFFL